MSYILALDQGTTSSRAILFDHQAEICGVQQQEFQQIFPQPGWVEHDALEIWDTQLRVVLDLISQKGLSWSQIKAIGITNQRETSVLWEKETGKPISNALVWQDRRTSGRCDELRALGKSKLIQEKTGLILDAYFSATKLEWMLDHVFGARERAEKGELCFGTIDSWLLWKLTDGAVHATDVSNASRTMLFNIHTLEWDKELLELFRIPPCLLPRVCSSSEVYGEFKHASVDHPVPIAGIAGDQQAALFGQLCHSPGMAKNTYGTGCFLMMNTGEQPIHSTNKLLSTVAWKINDKTEYALEGSVFIGGAAVQWLRDGLGVIESSKDVEQLARSVEDSGGVSFVPAFTGLGAPHWNQDARGALFGLTRGSTSGHIARATLEAIALQVSDIVLAMQADSDIQLQELRVDGGACANDLLMEIQAALLHVPVLRPKILELTALGAAYLAGLAVSFWKSQDELTAFHQIDYTFQPEQKIDGKMLHTQWERALRCVSLWSEQ